MSDPYRIFSPATDEERDRLRASIEANGLQSPVVMDDAENIIDGHERRDICEELGVDWLKNAIVLINLTEAEKFARAIELNLCRCTRIIDKKQRDKMLDTYLIARPELSGPSVASLFGVDQSTVSRRKAALIAAGEMPAVTKTIGKDGIERRVADRSEAQITVKNKKEYDALTPALEQVKQDLTGMQRHPKRIQALAERKQALAGVNAAQPTPLPPSIDIHHCDFRDLQRPDGSINKIITDPVWSPNAQPDWLELARLAHRWLADDGLFCAIIGTQSLPLFMNTMSQHLRYYWTMSIVLHQGYLSRTRRRYERWRPVVIFCKSKPQPLYGMIDTIFAERPREKQYHPWQQTLGTCYELVKRLTVPGDVVLDPHLGTGTNAVACSLLGDRSFIGCDVDEQQVRTARYRVANEGRQKPGEAAS